MADPPDAIDTEALAEQVVAELDPGSVINNKVVLSRRQLLALTGGGAGLAALGFGTGQASAADGSNDTSVGDVGAAGDSVDVFVDELRDDGGDEWLDVDDTGDINAAFRPWDFGTIRPSALGANLDAQSNNISNVGSLSTEKTDTTRLNTELFPYNPNRSLDTVYQNTRGIALLVTAIVKIDGSSTAETLAVRGLVGPSSSLGNGNRQDDVKLSNYDDVYRTTVQMYVPDGYYYKVTNDGDEINFGWYEQGLEQ